MHQHRRQNDHRINLSRVIVGKVRVHFLKNMDRYSITQPQKRRGLIESITILHTAIHTQTPLLVSLRASPAIWAPQAEIRCYLAPDG
jgi:hypothetical protein